MEGCMTLTVGDKMPKRGFLTMCVRRKRFSWFVIRILFALESTTITIIQYYLNLV